MGRAIALLALLLLLAPSARAGRPPAPGFKVPSCTPKNAGWKYMTGYDLEKLRDDSVISPKYVIGRIVCQKVPSTKNLSSVMKQIQKAYPGTLFMNNKDVIAMPRVGPVDVIRAAEHGGTAWQWLIPKWAQQGGEGDQASPAELTEAEKNAWVGCGPLPGWDKQKWFDPDYHTPRYDIGRILCRHTPETGTFAAALKLKALPEIRELLVHGRPIYFEAEVAGERGEKLAIPWAGLFDVLVNPEKGGTGWMWKTLCLADTEGCLPE